MIPGILLEVEVLQIKGKMPKEEKVKATSTGNRVCSREVLVILMLLGAGHGGGPR